MKALKVVFSLILSLLICSFLLTIVSCGDSVVNKNSIVVGIQNSLETLNPYKAGSAGEREVLFNIFESLIKCNIKGEYDPAVAESYSVSDDKCVYTFVIRKNIKFHNGKTLDIEDVIYSLNMAKQVSKSTSPLYGVELKKIDENTLEVKLEEANTELLPYISAMNASIVPADYDNELQVTNPVGTGPFKFNKHVYNESFVIERFDDYYLTDKKAKLDKVTFKIVASIDAAALELQAGTIDVFPNITEEKVSQITDKYNIIEGNQNLIQILALNNKIEPFNNEKVRQAVNYAVDKQAIVELISGNHGSTIGTHMSPKSMPQYYNKDTDSIYTRNIEKAKQLLEDAGYATGFEMTISVPSNYQLHVESAQVIVAQLKEVGINASIELVEWSTWLSDIYAKRNYQATIIGLTPLLTPRDALARYNSDASDNFVNFNNPQFDEIFALAEKEIDLSKKTEYYKQLQMILAEDAASVFIQDPSLLIAVNKRLDGYSVYPYYIQDMSTIYIRE